jgi:pyruvate dehydrogenase E1 component alpha subunit
MYRSGKDVMLFGYIKMLLIRKVEEALMDAFSAGEIPGFIHVCIGQEATPVAVCAHLNATDYIASTHRGHGHAIAKGIDLKLFMAELFGRQNGPCLGRSGSMHLAYSPLGIIGANGIVGGGIPIATGTAFASLYKRSGAVTVCFFGEGATSEGVFHESLNIASLWKLPIVYVCENNGWAEFSPKRVHMAVSDLVKHAASYGIKGESVPNDFMTIYQAAGGAVESARKGEGPFLLEVKSLRWHGHFVGDAQKYRPPEDIAAARSADCLESLKFNLLSDGILTPEKATEIEESIKNEVESAIAFARSSPVPSLEQLAEGLYI